MCPSRAIAKLRITKEFWNPRRPWRLSWKEAAAPMQAEMTRPAMITGCQTLCILLQAGGFWGNPRAFSQRRSSVTMSAPKKESSPQNWHYAVAGAAVCAAGYLAYKFFRGRTATNHKGASFPPRWQWRAGGRAPSVRGDCVVQSESLMAVSLQT